MTFSLVDTPEYFEKIYQSASIAGAKAAEAVTPPLMIVVDPTRIKEKPDDGSVRVLWFVPDGPVGLAVINLQPATRRFSRWMLKQGHAQRADVGAGINVAYIDTRQSYHRAAAYAHAFVTVINDAGLQVSATFELFYD